MIEITAHEDVPWIPAENPSYPRRRASRASFM
jgi:hypothetical protein